MKRRCAATATTLVGRRYLRCCLRDGHWGNHYWRGRAGKGRVETCSWIGTGVVVGAAAAPEPCGETGPDHMDPAGDYGGSYEARCGDEWHDDVVAFDAEAVAGRVAGEEGGA